MAQIAQFSVYKYAKYAKQNFPRPSLSRIDDSLPVLIDKPTMLSLCFQ